MLKNLTANAGDARDVGSIPGLGRSPGVGSGNSLHGPRSLADCSPWEHREWDMNERLSTQHTCGV